MKTYLKPASGSFNGSSWSKLVFYGSKLSICCLVRWLSWSSMGCWTSNQWPPTQTN